jgi:hypothetical protein
VDEKGNTLAGDYKDMYCLTFHQVLIGGPNQGTRNVHGIRLAQ